MSATVKGSIDIGTAQSVCSSTAAEMRASYGIASWFSVLRMTTTLACAATHRWRTCLPLEIVGHVRTTSWFRLPEQRATSSAPPKTRSSLGIEVTTIIQGTRMLIPLVKRASKAADGGTNGDLVRFKHLVDVSDSTIWQWLQHRSPEDRTACPMRD